MDTNTVEVIQCFGNKLDNYIQTVASKAGVAVDHFYPVLVKQQITEGWVSLISGIILPLIVCLVIAIVFYRPNKCFKLIEVVVVKVVAFSVFGFSSLIFLLNTIEITKIITKIYNPEYYALKSLAEMLK